MTNILLARGSPAARGKVDTVRYFRTDVAPVLAVKAECISVAGMVRYLNALLFVLRVWLENLYKIIGKFEGSNSLW